MDDYIIMMFIFIFIKKFEIWILAFKFKLVGQKSILCFDLRRLHEE